jgi:Tfp pilus assembly protein PilV
MAGAGERGRSHPNLLADVQLVRTMRLPSESGVTLMEVLVTMVLLTVALLGLAVAYPVGRAAVLQARVSTTAVALGEQRLEVARRTAYATLGSLAGTDSSTYAPYVVVTQVTTDWPIVGMTTVRVTVTTPQNQNPYGYAPDTGGESAILETFISGT